MSLVTLNRTVITATTSVSVNNVFSATYRNYLITLDDSFLASGTENVQLRWRVGGVDASGSNYTSQRLTGTGTASRGTTTQGTVYRVGAVNRGGGHLIVYNPAIAAPTTCMVKGPSGDTSGIIIENSATWHDVSTAYDGFTLFTTANLSGVVTTYGMGA